MRLVVKPASFSQFYAEGLQSGDMLDADLASAQSITLAANAVDRSLLGNERVCCQIVGMYDLRNENLQ